MANEDDPIELTTDEYAAYLAIVATARIVAEKGRDYTPDFDLVPAGLVRSLVRSIHELDRAREAKRQARNPNA